MDARKFSVAPMMDWTDRWCRRFHRLLTKRALLFTEMAVDKAVIHGDRARLIGFSDEEHPAALQLGGSEPDSLAEAARICAEFGYDEINLNVGCPSDRVQDGRFGACLMREPETVARAVEAMRAAANVPVTVKCRIGVDEQDPAETLPAFMRVVADAGCSVFYVHARKAWLQGLSPKENRDIPPLDYAIVRELKAARPELEIYLNGGLRTLDDAMREAEGLEGVMLGRAAYQTPRMLADVDARVFGDAAAAAADPRAVAHGLKQIIEEAMAAGRTPHAVTRHALGLFHGMAGGRHWRRVLSTEAMKPGARAHVIDQALAAMDDAERATRAA